MRETGAEIARRRLVRQVWRAIVRNTADVIQCNEEKIMKSLVLLAVTIDAAHKLVDSIDEGQYPGSAFIYIGEPHGATKPKSARRAAILRLLRIKARLLLGRWRRIEGVTGRWRNVIGKCLPGRKSLTHTAMRTCCSPSP
jgi:hypothetical protein